MKWGVIFYENFIPFCTIVAFVYGKLEMPLDKKIRKSVFIAAWFVVWYLLIMVHMCWPVGGSTVG